MPSSIRDAIGAAVKKARDKKDMYVQAAKDLSSMPGTAKDIVGPGRAGKELAGVNRRSRKRMTP